jgi:uncharacterized small protein (TIGR04563 family)
VRRDGLGAGSFHDRHDKRKQSLYFPEAMLKEITAEATRQDRSISWIVQKAWKVARKTILGLQAPPTPNGGDSELPSREK